jgi:hypothetical protein
MHPPARLVRLLPNVHAVLDLRAEAQAAFEDDGVRRAVSAMAAAASKPPKSGDQPRNQANRAWDKPRLGTGSLELPDRVRRRPDRAIAVVATTFHPGPEPESQPFACPTRIRLPAGSRTAKSRTPQS